MKRPDNIDDSIDWLYKAGFAISKTDSENIHVYGIKNAKKAVRGRGKMV